MGTGPDALGLELGIHIFQDSAPYLLNGDNNSIYLIC